MPKLKTTSRKKPSLKNTLSSFGVEYKRRDKVTKSLEQKDQKQNAPASKAQASGAASQQERRKKQNFPYTIEDTILCVGEANFSFALALANILTIGDNIVATTLDSEEVSCLKYPDCSSNVTALRDMGATVLFDVDATKLDSCEELRNRRFSRIVFNFPHTGSGIKDQDRNVQLNQTLLLLFFSSAARFLTSTTVPHNASNGAPVPDEPSLPDFLKTGSNAVEVAKSAKSAKSSHLSEPEKTYDETNGQIIVTLKTGKPYDLWKIKFLARQIVPYASLSTSSISSSSSTAAASSSSSSSTPPPPKLACLSSFDFDPSMYPGYAHRRTIGFKEGSSKENNEEILSTASSKTSTNADSTTSEPPRVYIFGVETKAATHSGNGDIAPGYAINAPGKVHSKKPKKGGKKQHNVYKMKG